MKTTTIRNTTKTSAWIQEGLNENAKAFLFGVVETRARQKTATFHNNFSKRDKQIMTASFHNNSQQNAPLTSGRGGGRLPQGRETQHFATKNSMETATNRNNCCPPYLWSGLGTVSLHKLFMSRA